MININIADLLPHDGDMVLLDHVIEYDNESLVAETTVRNDGLFGSHQSIPALIGIEYMAQTVAAHGGMMCHLAGRPINLGFLLGSRRYSSNVAEFIVGTSLTIKVKRILEDQGLAVFNCQILADGIKIMAKLNVYQPEQSKNKIIK